MRTDDVVVIGGGIVGLASAAALINATDCSITVLEAEDRLAAHQSGRNSGVIHSGLYYKPGSLKAALCAEGRSLMERFCDEHALPWERCGKIVVAVNEQELPRLETLESRARANGLSGIRRLDARGLREVEPHVAGVAGLHVPETGIADYAAVTRALAADVMAAGVAVRTGARAAAVIDDHGAFIVRTSSGDALRAHNILNCAGAQSDRVARMCGVEPGCRIIPFRGEYYQIVPARERLVRHLIYPVPDPAFPFLGVHFTRMVRGGVECGPNAVLSFSRDRYRRVSVNGRDVQDTLEWPGFWHLAAKHWRAGAGEFLRSWSKARFTRSLQRLIPEIREADLVPGHAGIRAQAIDADGSLVDDFRIIEGERMAHVVNAPSPAATASLAIGRHIASIASRRFGLRETSRRAA
jgi:L-2-hydroxyglutarate oxidase